MKHFTSWIETCPFNDLNAFLHSGRKFQLSCPDTDKVPVGEILSIERCPLLWTVL